MISFNTFPVFYIFKMSISRFLLTSSCTQNNIHVKKQLMKRITLLIILLFIVYLSGLSTYIGSNSRLVRKFNQVTRKRRVFTFQDPVQRFHSSQHCYVEQLSQSIASPRSSPDVEIEILQNCKIIPI